MTEGMTGTIEGRVCVVTGATGGIGQAAAMELARRGATVVLVARNAERAERTRAEAVRAAGHDRVGVVLADLSVQSQVRAAAARILERWPAVHVLINNAGLYTRRREESADGIEMQLAVNHLAPFLLTNLLLDRLRASAPARVVAISSGAHHLRARALRPLRVARDQHHGGAAPGQLRRRGLTQPRGGAGDHADAPVHPHPAHPAPFHPVFRRPLPARDAAALAP